MKHIRKHKLRLPLAFLLSLLLIFEGMSVAVFATDTTDTMASTEADTGMIAPEPPGMVVEDIESDVIISPPDISGEDDEQASVNATTTTPPIPEGIYCFKNVGNTGLYIDTQYDSSSPGYKLQQYAYSTRPTVTLANDGFAHGGLFKLSYRSSTNSYIIRSMTNNLLSYTFSGNNIITYEIPANDEDVLDSQTFTITMEESGIISIKPYGSAYVIAANNTTASGGAGAPDSYLVKKTPASAGNQGKWYYFRYNRSARHGFSMAQEPSSVVAGKAGSFKVKTWSTLINYNSYVLAIDNNTIATQEWFQFDRHLYATFNKAGIFNLDVYVSNGPSSTYAGSKEYTITLPFDPGIYFFMNRQTEKYMQIDDVGSTTMEVFSFDGDTDQKWAVEHHTGKYYKIRSIENNLYVTVPSGSYDSNNVSLQLQSFTGASGQLWYFETSPSSTSSYIIRSKSGESKTTDWCINVKTTIFGTNASDVVQSDFRDNTSYYDEWILEPYTITLCGITNYGHDHLGCLEDVQESMHDSGISHVNLISGSLTPDACLNYLKNTNVFTSRSHGDGIQYEGSDNIVATGILLNDGEGETAVALFSNQFLGMNDVSKVISSTDSFANTDLVLFIGCETAAGGENGRNLPSVVVSQGAEVAIGFTESIDCEAANEWTIEFYSYLLQGETVQEAVVLASEGKSEASGLKSAVICGNKNYVLY